VYNATLATYFTDTLFDVPLSALYQPLLHSVVAITTLNQHKSVTDKGNNNGLLFYNVVQLHMHNPDQQF